VERDKWLLVNCGQTLDGFGMTVSKVQLERQFKCLLLSAIRSTIQKSLHASSSGWRWRTSLPAVVVMLTMTSPLYLYAQTPAHRKEANGLSDSIWPLIRFVQSSALVESGLAEPQSDASATQAHRFFDATNILLTTFESGALLADGITTERIENRDPMHRWSREADPIARPFVEAGWPGQILGGALFVSAETGLRYLLHKRRHHRLERWLPSVLIAYGGVGAVRNARYWNAACPSAAGRNPCCRVPVPIFIK